MTISKYCIQAQPDGNFAGMYRLENVPKNSEFKRVLLMGRDVFVIAIHNETAPGDERRPMTRTVGFADGLRTIPSYMKYFDSIVVNTRIWHAFEKIA